MLRILAGGISVLLLVAAGFFIGKSRAEKEVVVPPAPAMAEAVQDDRSLPDPPSAEKSREEKRFDRYDKDRDERITRAELLAPRQKAYEKLDANRDGRLSFEEWAVSTSEKFSGADADGNGILSRSEFATTRRESKPKKCAC